MTIKTEKTDIVKMAGKIEKSSTLSEQLDDINLLKKHLEVKENLVIEKSLSSNDPGAILKASTLAAVKVKANPKNDWRKSTLVDPFSDYYSGQGYQHRPMAMSYNTLWRMSQAPIINAIKKTRKEQIAAFCQPQQTKFDQGFVVRKRKKYYEEDVEMTKDELKVASYITDILLKCGRGESWSRDDFATFVRKGVDDSLSFDQWNFEVVRDRRGKIFEFVAVDAMTVRVADSYDDDDYHRNPREEVGGYYPSYVQVIDSKIHAEFYPWELAFGVRNPVNRLNSNGYGRSELEDMVQVVTSLLWSDEYNRNFFKQGSAPKGILKLKGGGTADMMALNSKRIKEFKQAWRAMVAGVHNAWTTPILESDMEWIDLQKNSRDMEFSSWQEYLIKLSCALYTIDPTEIGFASGNTSNASPMFEGSNEAKLKYSRDKGLKPLLKFLESQINKYIVRQIHPDFVFEFVGFDSITEEEHRKKLMDEVANWKTINEIRKAENLPPIKGGDIVLNPTFTGAQQQEAMMQQSQGMEQEEEGEGEPFDPTAKYINPKEEGAEFDEGADFVKGDPFVNELNKYIEETLLT